MADFPSLSTIPEAEGWQEGTGIDPTMRVEMESGIVMTRSRFTTVPKMWRFAYRLMSNTDKETLETFEKDTVKYGADAFNWTNPIDTVVYSVRFGDKLLFQLEDTQQHQWSVSITLIEALPTS